MTFTFLQPLKDRFTPDEWGKMMKDILPDKTPYLTDTCADCKNKDICAVWNPKHYAFIDTKTACNQFEKEKDE